MFRYIFLSVVVVLLASPIHSWTSWAQPPACEPLCEIKGNSKMSRSSDSNGDDHRVQNPENRHSGNENTHDRVGKGPKKQDVHTTGDHDGLSSVTSTETISITAPMLDRNQMNPQATAPTCSLC